MAEHRKAKANLGTDPIGQLLREQSIPAAVGILSIIIYQIIDTIFVGNWVGTNAIGAITVVLPITFLISSVGMALGVGGSSVISRALGSDNTPKAWLTFGNLISLTFVFSICTVTFGYIFAEPLLKLFGGKGAIFELAYDYYMILLTTLPFLAWAMMSNNIIRAEGEAKTAMVTLIIPGVVNIILDALFIVGLGWGIKGAALATAISYFCCGAFTFWYFTSGRSSIRILAKNFKLNFAIVRETIAIGTTTFVRQGTSSLLSIVVNNTLFAYSGELGIAMYGIISRMMLFVFFPVFGLVQGSLPIIGFNYGAKQLSRVKETLSMAIKYGTAICLFIFLFIFLCSDQIIRVFTNDPQLLNMGGPALRMVFLAAPIIGIQALGAAYFQAIGKALPALLLTLSRQGFFLIPLILILPLYLKVLGVWYAFPISDTLSMLVTLAFLYPQWKKLSQLQEEI